jgi:hypothetical protein
MCSAGHRFHGYTFSRIFLVTTDRRQAAFRAQQGAARILTLLDAERDEKKGAKCCF